MYAFIKSMFDREALTAAQVWAMTDGPRPQLSTAQAAAICGPRPA